WDVYNQISGFYFEQGNFQKAEEYSRRVTELLDMNPIGFNNLGITLLYQEKYKEAINAYFSSLDKKRLPSTYHSLGTTYLYAGQCDKAVEAFNQGKVLDPNDAEFWGAAGDALSCSSAPQAASAYEQAIVLMTQQDISSDPNSLSLLAEWYARRNNKKLALQNIEAALQLAPNNYDCVLSAIKVYKLTNEPEKLKSQFEKAIKNRKSIFEVEHDPLVKELIQQQTYRTLIEQHKAQRG
ncbi:MAG TPA: tetratricopeptide repeat protein, partial [Blastocatellia bacterium]|nr:tetratricopeptide repeat protein [Blastocatellia bacterium]